MKAGLITVFLLLLAGALAGCGQKGPLYHDVSAEAGAGKQTDRTEQDADKR